MRGAKRHCKVHAKGIVAVHCRHRHLSYCIECSEVARPVKLQPNYYCDTHGPIYKAVSSKPICAVCETKLKPYPTAQKPAPKVKQRNLEPSSKSDKLKVIPAADQTVKTSEPIKKAPANWQLKGAILTSLKCNIHPTVSLHLCEDVNSMQMLICRKCRALGYTFSSLSGQSTLQVLPSENCESHPESAVHAVAGSDAKFCSSCASAQLNTDVFCRFHTDAVLVYSSCGKVVAACGMCRDIPLELKPKESRVMQPNSRLFCGMHPNSSITITSAKQIYCNSCRQGATTSTPPLPEMQHLLVHLLLVIFLLIFPNRIWPCVTVSFRKRKPPWRVLSRQLSVKYRIRRQTTKMWLY
ncbi:hypothetical protein EB796_017955 [Bugula neritina]|uniref:Uncharacterized protein n=1 Tax=Bugula neritina TaxID=10212 RepID=A0A7J7JCT4_BUGNE|nr:hypothetical protein EB796_017955 [Bugula neritina]